MENHLYSGRIKMMKPKTPSTALKIAVGYLLVASLWILFSDRAVGSMTQDPRLLTTLQNYKGWGFVLVTAGLLYIILRHQFRQLTAEIAERRQVEQTLRKTEEQVLLAVGAANVGLWDWDVLTNKVYYSPEWKRQIGYTEDEISDEFEEWRSRVHPDDLEQALATINAYLANPWPNYENEFRFLHKDGSYRWIIVRAALLLDTNGQPYRMLGAHLDITERKQAELTLKINQERLQMAQAIGKMGSWEYELDSNKIWGSDEGLRIFGIAPPPDNKLPIAEIEACIPERERVNQALVDLIAAEKPYDLIYAINPANGGSQRIINSIAVLVKNKEGQTPRVVGVIQDITERKQTEEELKRYSERLAILHQIDRGIITAASPQAIVDSVLKQIRQLIPCQRSAVALFDETTAEGVIFASDAEPELDTPDITTVPLSLDPRRQHLAAGQILITPDLQTQPEPGSVMNQLLIDLGLRAVLDAPLLAGGRLIGTLSLLSDQPGFFTPEHEEITAEIANLLAITINQNQLLENERRARHTAEVLLKTSHTLARSLDIDQVLDNLLVNLENLVPYDSACVMLRHGSQLAVYATRGYERWTDPAAVRRLTFEIDSETNPTAYQLVTQQVSVLIPDTRQNPYWQRDAGEHVLSWFGVPLVYDDDVIGMYSVDKTVPDFFNRDHVKLAESLAGYAAVAIKNAQLYRQTERHAAELEQRVAARTAELAVRNRELETFTYSVSHDLKAPLRGIDGYSRLLLEDHGPSLNDEGRAFLHTIRRATLQMNQLIEDLLAYSRLERRPLQAAQVNLKTLVESVLAERADVIPARGAVVRVDAPDVVVLADPDGLTMALRNLVDNALKFTGSTSTPMIEIGGQTNSYACIIWVKDNGIGFSMKFHSRIFDIFQRLHRAEEYPGTGIGLAIVRKAMERMGGKTWAESEPGQGATFYLEIPHSR